MIGKLRGAVDAVGVDYAVIDVGGVGYEVACSSRTLAALPAAGEPVTLSIDTHVRQDAIRLYGFLTETERGWFRLLQSVQGVGSKVALSILSTLDTAQLGQAIALQDKAMVARAPGVGPKVALRIVNELRDKAPPAAISANGLPMAANSRRRRACRCRLPSDRGHIRTPQSRLRTGSSECRSLRCAAEGGRSTAHRDPNPAGPQRAGSLGVRKVAQCSHLT